MITLADPAIRRKCAAGCGDHGHDLIPGGQVRLALETRSAGYVATSSPDCPGTCPSTSLITPYW